MTSIALDFHEKYEETVPAEIVDGVFVRMDPARTNHQYTMHNIWRILDRHLWGGKCRVLTDFFVHFDENNMFVPDLIVVCNPEIITKDGVFGTPDLVVEILSPSTSKRDRGHKKSVYEKHGVKEYWIVDTKNRAVEVYTLRENGFELSNVYYADFPKRELERMSESERAAVTHTFKSSLFDDLTIDALEIFEDLL